MNKKIVCFALLAAAVAVTFVITAKSRVTAVVSPERYQQILEEITSVQYSIGSLTPDHSGTKLAYVHATEFGRGISILDLATLQKQTLEITNEVTNINGWSPDDRHLAFVQTLPPHASPKNPFGLRESWITVFDKQSKSTRRLTKSSNVFEQHFLWLNTNDYAFANRWLTNDYGDLLYSGLNSNELKKICNARLETVFISSNLLGHLEKGNIFSLEVKPLQAADTGSSHNSRTIHQLSDFPPDAFTEFKWLRYSAHTSNFLFCAKPAASNWRYLYKFDPTDKKLTQLSNEDTYNGQWLQHGEGFAYVINTNGGFYLAVRPKESDGHTNLFVSGNVANYTVAPDGNLIFITAANGSNPQTIWAYDIEKRALRSVFQKDGKEFTAANPLTPTEFKVRSFDDLSVPCLLLKPAGLTGSSASSRKNYPAVIYVPPKTSQFQKGFEERSQLIANLDYYFLAVNYRGCDGYGKEYSALAHTANAVQDILKAREALLEDPQVDPENIFLCTISAGGGLTYEVLAAAPGLWRGAVFDKPGRFSFDPRFDPKKFPPLLFITGDQDPAFETVHEFISWAQAQNVNITSVVHTNSGHFTFKKEERRDKLHKTAVFLRENLK